MKVKRGGSLNWLLTDKFLMSNMLFMGFKLEMNVMTSARPTKRKSFFIWRRHVKINNLDICKKMQ